MATGVQKQPQRYRAFALGAVLVLSTALCGASAGAQGISAGLSFLALQQRSDGTWGDPSMTGVRDTTVVADTLAALGQNGVDYTQGIAALNNAVVGNTDYLGRQLVSLAGAQVDVSTLAIQLFDAQAAESTSPTRPNFPEGGWGIESGFATDTLDTALALRALNVAGFNGGVAVVGEAIGVAATSPAHAFIFPAGASALEVLVRATTGAIRVLITTPSSGTFFVDLNPTTVPSSIGSLPQQTGTYSLQVQNQAGVAVTYSLEARFTRVDGFDVSRVTTPLTYLGLAQNVDGGWGIARGEDSNVMVTAEVLATLEAYGATFAPATAITTGIAWLVTNHQHGDGGFGSQPGTSTTYETALAALAIQGGNPASPALAAARNFLVTTQLANGSWNDDAYQTALAVRALVGVGPVTRVNLGTGVGRPGGIACVPATLAAGGTAVAATTNDVGFAANLFTISGCTINPAIGPATGPNKQLSLNAISSGVARVGIAGANMNVIPDGTLYGCTVAVNSAAVPGTYALGNAPGAASPGGATIPIVTGTAAQILVTQCTGDCNGNGIVTIGEVIKCVNLFLGQPFCNPSNPILSCPVADASLNGGVSIGEVIQCVNRFLNGC